MEQTLVDILLDIILRNHHFHVVSVLKASIYFDNVPSKCPKLLSDIFPKFFAKNVVGFEW